MSLADPQPSLAYRHPAGFRSEVVAADILRRPSHGDLNFTIHQPAEHPERPSLLGKACDVPGVAR
jgi:hypothetical protein